MYLSSSLTCNSAQFTGTVSAQTFSGNATSADNINLTGDNTNGTYYIPFSKSTSGTSQLFLDNTIGALSYNPSTGILTSGTFSGSLNNTGGITGTGSISTSGLIGYTSATRVITQPTSKSTPVTLNSTFGQITMNSDSLAAGVIVSFILMNSTISAGDVLILNHIAGGTLGGYTLNAACGTGSVAIYVRNNTTDTLSEAIVISFVLIKTTL
jgi:hypothetical protein